MVNIIAYAALKRLLDEVGVSGEQLMPNELETYRSLAMKYAEPVNPDATDMACLEVILRNIEIRRGYDFDPATDGGRVIDLPLSKKE